jgi:hypothetical protein
MQIQADYAVRAVLYLAKLGYDRRAAGQLHRLQPNLFVPFHSIMVNPA